MDCPWGNPDWLDYGVANHEYPEKYGVCGGWATLFSSLIGFGLVLTGAILFIKSRPSQHPETEDTMVDPEHPLEREIPHANWKMFGIASAALIIHMSTISTLGFTLAGTILCFGICLALESQHKVRDLILSFLLALGLFHLFKWLGLNLPALLVGGWL